MSLKPTIDHCLEKVDKGLVKLKCLKKGRKISVTVLRQCLFAYVFPHLAWIFPFYSFLPKTQREALDRKFRVAIMTLDRCPYPVRRFRPQETAGTDRKEEEKSPVPAEKHRKLTEYGSSIPVTVSSCRF